MELHVRISIFYHIINIVFGSLAGISRGVMYKFVLMAIL